MIRKRHKIDNELILHFLKTNNFNNSIQQSLLDWYALLINKDYKQNRDKAIEFIKGIAEDVFGEVEFSKQDKNKLINVFIHVDAGRSFQVRPLRHKRLISKQLAPGPKTALPCGIISVFQLTAIAGGLLIVSGWGKAIRFYCFLFHKLFHIARIAEKAPLPSFFYYKS